jgi:Putative peptidoglycan binding domain
MIRILLIGTAAFALAGCVGAGGPGQGDLTPNLLAAIDDTPPTLPEGACWARDTTPAVIETEMRQEMVAPARVAKDGTQIPASFRSVTQQKIVQDRRDVWFQRPCDDQMTVGFVASLQRALKARGLYRAPVTGMMDTATTEAVRRYQAARGLDSPVLSLAAARDLGIAPTDLSEL